MHATQLLALYGCSEPPPPRRALHAGPLHCELVGGRFGPVLANGHEVWHGLAFLFRDAGWGTPEPVFEQVEQQHHDDQGFELTLRGHIPCEAADVAGTPDPHARILLQLHVRGHADGTLQLHAQATPTHDLHTNRCGWVLLHPMQAVGQAVEILHGDGRSSRSTLPETVPAWPPFTALRAIRHEYAPGCWAEAWMPDDDYELEDQRNNADASFKTYSRSNQMPRPYLLRRGQSLQHSLHLRLLGDSAPPHAPAARRSVATRPAPPRHENPALRLGLAITPDDAAEPVLLEVLRRWRPSYLHMTLWPQTAHTGIDWDGIRAMLLASGASLRLDLCSSAELGNGGAQDLACEDLALRLRQAGIEPGAVAALPCGPHAAALLRRCFTGAAIGGGTAHFFAQLNRLESSGGEDFMGFTVCPIVHDAADANVMLSLRSLPSLLQTARLRHPGRDWQLGPSWLPARASPLGRQPSGDGAHRIALARMDPRTRGLFGAAWLLGHLAAALEAGVQALSLPPLLGDSGLGRISAARWEETPAAAWIDVCLRWHAPRLHDWQVHDVDCGAFAGWPLVAITGTGPHGAQVLLANLSEKPQTLHWARRGQLFCLDAQAWSQHLKMPGPSPWRASGACPANITLGPYALARIDLPHLAAD